MRDYLYAISYAQYFAPSGCNDGHCNGNEKTSFNYSTATTPQVIDGFKKGSDLSIAVTMEFVKLAKALGVQTASYEGGPGYHVGAEKPGSKGLRTMIESSRDAGMKEVVKQHVDTCWQFGWTVYNYFAAQGKVSEYGCFGATESWADLSPGPPKLQGLYELTGHSPDSLAAWAADPDRRRAAEPRGILGSQQPSPPALALKVVGPGESKENPAFGMHVTLAVSCGEDACPPWVRIDRTDGVSDASPYVSVADEANMFGWAPQFPTFFRPAWGPFEFSFGGAADNAPIPVVASGWTAERNGTRLTQNSSSTTIYYDVGFLHTTFRMQVEDIGPGSVRVTAVPENTSSSHVAFDQVKFDRFTLTKNASGSSPPEFASSFFYHQESESGSIVLTFQQPGVYYWAATPSFEGRTGGSSAGGMYDGAPSTHPTALVLAGPDGDTGNESVAQGFAGEVHHLTPLRVPRQFCITTPNVTVASGGQLFVPLCRPDPHNEIPKQPQFASVLVPSWLTVLPQNNETCPGCRNQAYWAHVNSTAAVGDRVRITFSTAGYRNSHRWSIYNNVRAAFGFVPSAESR
eukprot:COSAG04_NODE_865_length_9768_cov_3.722130_2_plen_573_part_00